MFEAMLKLYKQKMKEFDRANPELARIIIGLCLVLAFALGLQYIYAWSLKKMEFEIGYAMGIMSMLAVVIGVAIMWGKEIHSHDNVNKQMLYWKQREKMLIEILKRFDIDYKDNSKIELIIEETQRYQEKQEKRLKEIKKCFPAIMGNMISFIIGIMIDAFVSLITEEAVLRLGIMVIGIVMAIIAINIALRAIVVPIIKEKYEITTCEDLIGELREIQLFTEA